MSGESEEARKRKEDRLRRDTEKFKANLKVTRPGFGGDYSSKTGAKIEAPESLEAGKERLELSGILWLSPEQLQENPYNDYPPLSGEELMELAKDIAEKGVLVPLIVRVSEDVLICGHNRRRASIEAKEPKVPVQRVLRLLSEEEEREIMKSENDRRRGGNWSKEKKEEFIREHFSDRLEEDNRGAHKKLNSKKFNEPFESKGDNGGKKFSELLETENQNFTEVLKGENGNTTNHESIASSLNDSPGKKFNEPLAGEPLNLAKEIEEKSKGNITEGTAKRILSEMKKEKRKEKPAEVREKKKSSLSEKDRRRGEKLALHLKTLRQTREKLEEKLNHVKTEEKRVLKELKSIGQPELFGVEL
jgi:hypothetical protein